MTPKTFRDGTPIPVVHIWQSDFGDIRLPDDFPVHVFRKDGWWDRRFKKERERAEAFIAAETEKLKQRFLRR